jgi:hypothetical protein
MSDAAIISDNIYKQARAGTSVNPNGLPDALSQLIVAQTKHETATEVNGAWLPFTSHAFLENNNAIGYKFVNSKYQDGPGIQSSESDSYGNYDTYQDSIKELVDWIYRRVAEGTFPANLSTITTPEQYASVLKDAGYYGAPVSQYAAGLRNWLTSNPVKAGGIGFVLLIGIIFIGRLIYKNH